MVYLGDCATTGGSNQCWTGMDFLQIPDSGLEKFSFSFCFFSHTWQVVLIHNG